MYCNKCGVENKEQNNYCINDGEYLAPINKKYVLNQISSENCNICNSKIEKYNNYCSGCGNSQNEIVRRKSASINKDEIANIGTNTEKIKSIKVPSIPNLKDRSFKVDFKVCIFAALLTLCCVGVVAGIMNIICINELEEISMGIKNEIPAGKFTLLTMVSYNIARLFIDIEVGMISIGNFTFSMSSIVGPIIVILSSLLSTLILIKNNEKTENIELNASSIALMYSTMTLLVAFISKTNIIAEEVMLTIKITSFIKLFISSFIISFIGAYIAIHIKLREQRTIYSSLFNSSIITIFISVLITIIIIYVALSSIEPNESMSYFMSEFATSISDLESISKFILALLFSPWLFIMSNFTKLNIIDIKSYSLLDLFDIFSPILILIIIVPIVCFLINGSTINSKYKKHNPIKIVSIFSLIYSLIIGLISYATTLYMSAGQTFINEYLDEIMYEMSYMNNYLENSFIQSYIDSIYNTLQNGLSIGPSILSSIIGSFIFSFVFVFIGYKIKNISLKEGEM